VPFMKENFITIKEEKICSENIGYIIIVYLIKKDIDLVLKIVKLN